MRVPDGYANPVLMVPSAPVVNDSSCSCVTPSKTKSVFDASADPTYLSVNAKSSCLLTGTVPTPFPPQIHEKSIPCPMLRSPASPPVAPTTMTIRMITKTVWSLIVDFPPFFRRYDLSISTT